MVNVLLDSPGIPAFESEVYVGPVSPFSGDTPPPVTVSALVPASSTFEIYTPVEIDGTGNIIPVVQGVNQPNAITAAKVTTGVGETSECPVYIAGCFNPKMLNWPASFDLDAEQDAAFMGLSSPYNIVLKRAYYNPSA